METEVCRAIIEQGKQKGTQCTRPSLENGYCGKHCKQAILELTIKENKKKCLTHRCIVLIEKDLDTVYCEGCIATKAEKSQSEKICIALIESSKSKKKCNKIATFGEFCGKHSKRNILLKEASEKGIRICDDGKRSCKNITKENKLKCEECLEKSRATDRKEYQVRQLDPNICLGCGIPMNELVRGFRIETVKRCASCYEKLKEVEEQRIRKERDFNKERKNNIMRHYNEYRRSAILRNLQFELNENLFEELVNSHCHYCNTYDKDKVIGIDRINSLLGYIENNVLPCCATCNHLKGDLQYDEFLELIVKICNNMKIKGNLPRIEETTSTPSYMRPRKILEYYKRGKLTDYIDLCKKDNRSPLLLEKIKDLSLKKVGEKEFIKTIKNILLSEVNYNRKNERSNRQRIPNKILYEYFESNKKDEIIKLYEDVHGIVEGFRDDVGELSTVWQNTSAIDKPLLLNKLLIKYQNKRNRTPSA